jgi:hypothetical protein
MVDRVCADAGAASAREFLLDLRGVTFLDCAAFRAISRAEQNVAERGWVVRIARPVARGPQRLMDLATRAMGGRIEASAVPASTIEV